MPLCLNVTAIKGQVLPEKKNTATFTDSIRLFGLIPTKGKANSNVWESVHILFLTGEGLKIPP